MKAWLSKLSADLPADLHSPEELACFELSHALPGITYRTETVHVLGEGYLVEKEPDGFHISGGPTGVLYGAYALIRRTLSGDTVPDRMASSPR